MSNDTSFWPEDGEALRGSTLDRFLMWCTDQEASRIEIQTSTRIMIRVHGRNRTVTSSRCLSHDVEEALEYVYRSSAAVAQIRGGTPLDLNHTFRGSSDTKQRRYSYRINAIGAQIGPEASLSMTFRPMADIPRPLEDQNVEPALLKALEGERGMFLISGATGSGKTTLMGGVNRARLENPDIHCDLLEGSQPLELLYDLIKAINSTITQVQIPRDVPTFGEFIRAAMRREPTDIIVGECRESDTMQSAIQAAISGHRLTSSLHTFDCASTVRRVEALCPRDQRDSLMIAFVENLRLLVNQRLLPSTDGKRTAIREFLPLSRKTRNKMLDSPRENWPQIIREALESEGQSFEQSIKDTHAKGLISDEVARLATLEEQ